MIKLLKSKSDYLLSIIKIRSWMVFIATGQLQMIVARGLNLHKGLDHMVFTEWWQYGLEGLFYSLCHCMLYQWMKNGA